MRKALMFLLMFTVSGFSVAEARLPQPARSRWKIKQMGPARQTGYARTPEPKYRPIKTGWGTAPVRSGWQVVPAHGAPAPGSRYKVGNNPGRLRY